MEHTRVKQPHKGKEKHGTAQPNMCTLQRPQERVDRKRGTLFEAIGFGGNAENFSLAKNDQSIVGE